MNDVMMTLMTGRGERIIRYLNIIQIVAAQHYYSYLYSGDFFKPNNICIRIWSFLESRKTHIHEKCAFIKVYFLFKRHKNILKR